MFLCCQQVGDAAPSAVHITDSEETTGAAEEPAITPLSFIQIKHIFVISSFTIHASFSAFKIKRGLWNKVQIMRNLVFICFSSYCLQNMKGILMASNEGRLIAAALEKEKSITIKQRRAMVRILVAFLIETFGEMWVTKDLF